MTPSLTVIIPAYDDLVGVLTALNSLRALSTTDATYHVQDDASPAVRFPAVIPTEIADVARNDDNRGFAGNCNAAADHASGDVLVFINQDVYGVYGWSDDWDAPLRAAFADESVGVVGARLLFPDGRVQSAGGLIDAHGQPFHRCLGWRDPAHHTVATPHAVTWVTGAALAIRRDLFAALGGFDTHFSPAYFEDVDLCLRAREYGCRVVYEPRWTLVHRVGSTGGSAQFRRSALRFKHRWVDSGRVTPDVPYVRERFW